MACDNSKSTTAFTCRLVDLRRSGECARFLASYRRIPDALPPRCNGVGRKRDCSATEAVGIPGHSEVFGWIRRSAGTGRVPCDHGEVVGQPVELCDPEPVDINVLRLSMVTSTDHDLLTERRAAL